MGRVDSVDSAASLIIGAVTFSELQDEHNTTETWRIHYLLCCPSDSGVNEIASSCSFTLPFPLFSIPFPEYDRRHPLSIANIQRSYHLSVQHQKYFGVELRNDSFVLGEVGEDGEVHSHHLSVSYCL